MPEHRKVNAAAVLAAKRERRRQLTIDFALERRAIVTESGDVSEERAREIATCEARLEAEAGCAPFERTWECTCGAGHLRGGR